MNELSFAQQSIRTRLTLYFIGLAIIPLFLVSTLTIQSARSSLTDAANQALGSVASASASSIDNFVSNNLTAIRFESQLPSLLEFLHEETEGIDDAHHGEASDLLFRLHADQNSIVPFVYDYSLLDERGNVLLNTAKPSSEESPYVGQNFSDREYFRNAVDTFEPTVSLEVTEDTQIGVLAFATVVRDEPGILAGVLVTRYDIAVLQDLVVSKNDEAGEGSFGVLFDQNLIHLAHGADENVIFKATSPLSELEISQLKADRQLPNLPREELIIDDDLSELSDNLENAQIEPFFEAEDVATGDLVNQVAVAQLETFPWQMAFFQPQEIYLAPVSQQSTTTFFLVAIVTVFAIGIAFSAARGISEPILALSSTAERVAGGDLTTGARVDSNDELGQLARTFNSMMEQLRRTLTELEERVSERTALLEATADVSRAASSTLDTDALISQVVNLVSDKFGYYYAAIFLTDENGTWANLLDATGEAGNALKARNHRLQIGGLSMVGSAISTQRPRIAQSVGGERVRFDNPFLPETRSEIAVPLTAGNQVLGALDVQSTKESAFGESEIDTLQNIANQVAVALQNTQLFETSQKNLDELTRLNRVFVRKGWKSISKEQTRTYYYTAEAGMDTTARMISPDIVKSIQKKSLVIEQDNGLSSLSIPLSIRGEIIGVINLKTEKIEWTEDDLAIIEAVSQQAAFALENARLVEAAQRTATQEQQIAEMTDRIRSVADVEGIIKTAVSELGEALGVREATIQLGTDDRGNHNE